MSDFDAHEQQIKRLRALGVIHYKADFEVTLGYPFDDGRTRPAAREGGTMTSTLPASEHAADLVLNPPDLSKAVED